MNSKIRELANRALRKVEHRPGTGICVIDELLVEFADLVIQDSINSIRNEWYKINDQPYESDPRSIGIQIGTKAGLTTAMNTIRKNFSDDT